jgi:Protein of unknown function (DUF2934)
MEPGILEASQVSQEVREQIAQCAFHLYEARGRQDGDDVEDWLQAEGELRRAAIQPKASIASAIYED